MLHLDDTPNTPLMVSNPDQEVILPDKLQRIAEEIETTSNEKTAMVLMHKLVLEQGMNYFAMGGLLKRMNEKKWYCGRDTFKAFCLEVLGFHPRKGLYLIQIFDTLIEAKLTWDDIEDVGWTKLRILCSKVTRSRRLLRRRLGGLWRHAGRRVGRRLVPASCRRFRGCGLGDG